MGDGLYNNSTITQTALDEACPSHPVIRKSISIGGCLPADGSFLSFFFLTLFGGQHAC